MIRLALGCVIALSASSMVVVRADEPDSIRKELDKARALRAEADAKASAGLLAAFDEAIKTVAGLGDLDGVRRLQAEKKAFEDSGKIPDSPKMGNAAADYQKVSKAAQTALEKAYESAIKESTKALKIEQAEAMRTELKALQPNTSSSRVVFDKGEGPAAKGKWVAGTWNIRYTPNRTERTYVVKANGDAVSLDGKMIGPLKPQDGAFLLDFGDRIERITFANTRMFVEHFYPKGDLERNLPNQIGIGELVKAK